MVAWIKREFVGGLSLIFAGATLAGSDFKFTRLVLGLLAFGGLWTVVVLAWRKSLSSVQRR